MLLFPGDRALVEALQQDRPGAREALFQRYGDYLHGILVRTLGHHAEVADLLQDVFVAILRSIHRLRDGAALKGWLTQLAVMTARMHLRSCARKRWLRLLPPEEIPEVEVEGVDPAARAALRATYQVLVRLPADDRLAFTLRFIQGMELTEVASAFRVSLATIKRRIARAEERFRALAAEVPELEEWVRLPGGAGGRR